VRAGHASAGARVRRSCGSTGRHQIVENAYRLAAGRGVLTLGRVISGGADDRLARSFQAERVLRQHIGGEGIGALPAVVVDDDVLAGVKALLQCHGIGGVRPNTMLLGWGDDPEEIERFANIFRISQRLQRNALIVKREHVREDWDVPPGEIHIWWHGRKNCPLMLLLAHLLAQNDVFRRRRVRLIHVIPEEAGRECARQHLVDLTERARVEIDPMIIVTENLREAMLSVDREV